MFLFLFVCFIFVLVFPSEVWGVVVFFVLLSILSFFFFFSFIFSFWFFLSFIHSLRAIWAMAVVGNSYVMTHDLTDTLMKEGNPLFNDALNTFYLRLYGVGHIMVTDILW